MSRAQRPPRTAALAALPAWALAFAAASTAAADGQALFAQRCQSCHAVEAPAAEQRWRAAFAAKGPSLAAAGSKLNPAYLAQWLAQPRSVRGGNYPYFRWVQPTPEGDRLPAREFEHPALGGDDAAAVAAYLGTLKAELQAFPPQPPLPAATTKVLFDKVAACGGCHAADAAAPRSGPLLQRAAERLGGDWLAAYLMDPQQFGSVNMPKTRLRMDQVASLVQYVMAPSPAASSAAGAPPAPAAPSAPAAPALDADSPRGALIYRVVCSQCHGVQGDGHGINARFLSVEPRNHRSAEMAKLSDEHLYRVIRYGGTAVDKSALMPSWGSVLGDAEIQDVIAYLKTLRQ